MSKSPRSGWLDVHDGKLWFEESGQGVPIVFLHASIADSRMWDREFGALARDHRVVRPDLRGLGRSPPATSPYSDVDDLHRLAQELELDPAVLVGCSNGGRLALDFAVTHPERVAGLLLIAAGVSGWGPEVDPDGAADYRRDMERSAGIMEHWRSGRRDAALAALRDYWASACPEAARPRVEAMLRENADEIFTEKSASHQQGIVPPALGRLKELRIPATMLYGDRDEPTVGYLARRVVRSLPGAIFVDVPGADHLVNISQPAAFDRSLRELLDRLPLGRRPD